MIGLPGNTLASSPQRARDELATAWDHLVAAAEHRARQVGQTGKRRGVTARDRATQAGLALRGGQPQSRWRWLATGLVAGVVVGAVGAVVLAGRRRAVHEAGPGQPSPAMTMCDQAGAAVHDATAAARNTAAKVRGKVTGQDPATEPQPGGLSASEPPRNQP